MKFKVGDYVKLVNPVGHTEKSQIGINKIFKIKSFQKNRSFGYDIVCLDKSYDDVMEYELRPYSVCRDSEIVMASDEEVLAWSI